MIKFGPIGASQMALVVNNSLANKEDVRDTGLILGLGRSPGEGQGNPFLFFFFCLENPMDRGDWWDTVHGVAQSQTQLKQLSTHHESESEVTQLCPTLCNPMNCSLPGPSVHGIFQARVLEWVAISFSIRGLQETRVATREESGVLGFPSRRGLTPRGSLECNPEIPAFPGEEY